MLNKSLSAIPVKPARIVVYEVKPIEFIEVCFIVEINAKAKGNTKTKRMVVA